MKKYITMLNLKKYDLYQIPETMNSVFFSITELFSTFIFKGELVEWFHSNELYFTRSSYVGIDKEGDTIEIGILPSEFFPSDDPESYDIYEQRFIMTKENFLQIITQWDELQVSRPDIILVVLHEDNHVSLETDPVIIKEYQDAGYAFDYTKAKR